MVLFFLLLPLIIWQYSANLRNRYHNILCTAKENLCKEIRKLFAFYMVTYNFIMYNHLRSTICLDCSQAVQLSDRPIQRRSHSRYCPKTNRYCTVSSISVNLFNNFNIYYIWADAAYVSQLSTTQQRARPTKQFRRNNWET